jgi:hypothetical protein
MVIGLLGVPAGLLGNELSIRFGLRIAVAGLVGAGATALLSGHAELRESP